MTELTLHFYVKHPTTGEKVGGSLDLKIESVDQIPTTLRAAGVAMAVYMRPVFEGIAGE